MDVVDPVGGSLVASLARPGGDAIGFLSSEFGFSGKWLELLKDIAPRVRRVVVIRDSAIAFQIGMFGGIQSVAPSLGVELLPIDICDTGEMERAVVEFAGAPEKTVLARSRFAVALLKSDHVSHGPHDASGNNRAVSTAARPP